MTDRHSPTQAIRAHVLEVLRGGHAHVTFDDAVDSLKVANLGLRPEGCPYSAWQLVEHIRIAQRDILDYSRAKDAASYDSPSWPDGYWPKEAAPPSTAAWTASLAAVLADRQAMERLIEEGDLFAKLPAANEGQTLLREALLVADHTAYHVGELVLLRRLLNDWE
jgi:DinB superfamily